MLHHCQTINSIDVTFNSIYESYRETVSFVSIALVPLETYPYSDIDFSHVHKIIHEIL